MPDKRMAVWQGDITTLDVDAIVNAANEQLLPGGGVCGAIHDAAGPALEDACLAFGGCPTGDARITPGFSLAARHVIHAVGPVWRGGDQGEPDLLEGCYRASLLLAEANGVESLAFPCISTGVYGYPAELAAEVAVRTIRSWQAENELPDKVILCTFGEEDTGYRSVGSRNQVRAKVTSVGVWRMPRMPEIRA